VTKIIFSKVMWVGRAAVFLVGLTVIVAATFGVASEASARVPSVKKGVVNTVKSVTTLVGSLADPILRLDNNGAGPALELQVEPGKAPMTVNSDTKVDNLNTDKLDGKDESAFAPVSGFGADEVIGRVGPLPLEGTYTSKGGTLVIFASGSGFRSSANTRFSGRIGMNVFVDGIFQGRAEVFTDERDSHKAFVGDYAVVEGLPADNHTIRLEAVYFEPFCNTAAERPDFSCTTTDSVDFFRVTVMELPV
jgi:hypothetical protein